VFLAERYANLIKYLFLVLWYCVLFPAGFFMGSLALWMVYFVDCFSLVRSWARHPQVAVFAMASSSSVYWAQFPFDNLCKDNITKLHPGYANQWTIDIPAKNSTKLGILFFTGKLTRAVFNTSLSDQVYAYCDQQMSKLTSWMTSNQEVVVDVAHYASLVVMYLFYSVVIWQVFNDVWQCFQRTWTRTSPSAKW